MVTGRCFIVMTGLANDTKQPSLKFVTEIIICECMAEVYLWRHIKNIVLWLSVSKYAILSNIVAI